MRKRIQVGDTVVIGEARHLHSFYYGKTAHVVAVIGQEMHPITGKREPLFNLCLIGERPERDGHRNINSYKSDLKRLHPAPNYNYFLKKVRPELKIVKTNHRTGKRQYDLRNPNNQSQQPASPRSRFALVTEREVRYRMMSNPEITRSGSQNETSLPAGDLSFI